MATYGTHVVRAGAVVIGRNEGTRLHRCLQSLIGHADPLVYVDSGSSDGSADHARALDIETVDLSRSTGFTAARARNAGFARIMAIAPDLDFVQFVDGDCELDPDWLPAACAVLAGEATLAAVCGRRRERDPQASAYNRMCDYEWDTPIGLAKTVGGDALIRASAFAAVDGFSPELIAGEEPDLCHRLRQAGWLIRRIDREMTLHDAAMTRFSQWWQRSRRSGYAMAEGWTRRRDYRRHIASNTLWSLPIAWPLWPLLWWRAARQRGALYATFITIGKLPHLHGQIDYWTTQKKLIEYK